ncbi:hypothetical protein OPQ81_008944 [Rhizoctonia solani]|nr:hypothetical protein OPQ81_008944 [Rhizoctonia solani]
MGSDPHPRIRLLVDDLNFQRPFTSYRTYQNRIVTASTCRTIRNSNLSSHGGIGYSLCEEFAANGCVVYAMGRRLEAMSSFTHPSIRPLIMDVTSDNSVHEAVEYIIEETGRVDIVVANAGIACFGPILEVPIEQAKHTLDTNVLGVLRLAQEVFPYMAAKKRGTFITIGSVVGCTPTPWVVMLVLTGGVRSNVVNNAKFSLPPTSLFTQYLPKILARIRLSQVGPSMPTAEFARGVVSAALRKGGAPRILAHGAHTSLFKVLRWLPKAWVMWYLWRRMGALRK